MRVQENVGNARMKSGIATTHVDVRGRLRVISAFLRPKPKNVSSMLYYTVSIVCRE